MFDRRAAQLIGPVLQGLARLLVARGVGADALTLSGFSIGLLAALAITAQAFVLALALILVSRVLDGLDGAVARLTQPTDRGAFLDITLDFLFYASVPLAFAIAAPAENALPAATLLAAFMGTSSSFLAFAALAEKHGLKSTAYPHKGLHYLGGLTEASETLACFVLMCVWPQHFAWWSYGFALLCGLTIATRLLAGWQQLRP
jgi:phosphatidylglycerophosphate synthase